MSRMSSLPEERSASSATTKKIGSVTSAWLTACSNPPSPGRGVVERKDAERDEAELGHRRVAEDQPGVGLVNAIAEP